MSGMREAGRPDTGIGIGHLYQRDRDRDQAPALAAAVPDVPLNLGHLASNVDSLHTIISDLEQRLGSVMRPPSPKTCGVTPCPETSQENVARRISDSSTLVRSAYERVVEIMSRLEV